MVDQHDHPAGVPHELQTAPEQHMLMVYWWAVDAETVPGHETGYHFSHYVTDSCAESRIPEYELDSGTSIPDDSEDFTCYAKEQEGEEEEIEPKHLDVETMDVTYHKETTTADDFVDT